MALYTYHHDAPTIAAAGRQWAASCLVRDTSVLGEAALATLENLRELQRCFIERPDDGAGTFYDKLRLQMQDATPEACRLMAELLWALFLFPSNIGADAKRDSIIFVWDWSGTALDPAHPMLSAAVLEGVGSGGPGIHAYRANELAYMIGLMTHFKQLTPGKRAEVVGDYDAFMDWIERVPMDGERQFRHMLRYFLFPERVERMSSNGDRRRILEAFGVADARQTRKWSDRQLDTALLDLRNALAAEHGTEDIDFYLEPLRDRWMRENEDESASATPDGETAFALGYAALRERFLARMPGFNTFAASARYREQERDYKDELLQLFAETVRAALDRKQWDKAGEAFLNLLTRPLRSAGNKPQNIVGWRYVDEIRSLGAEGRTHFAEALGGLLDDTTPVAPRVEAFLARWRNLTPGDGWVQPAVQRSVVGFCLALAYPDRHIFLKTAEMKRALRTLDPGFNWTASRLAGSDVAKVDALASRVFQRLQQEGWEPRDLLDAQGFLWTASYREGTQVAEDAEDSEDMTPPPVSQQLAAPQRPGRNLILYGPPGTGKTWRLRKMFGDYVDPVTDIDAETWTQQLVARFGWRPVIAAALAHVGKPAKVNAVVEHPLVVSKFRQARRKHSPHATLWGYLQAHSLPESVTVNVAAKRPPSIFDKTADSEWRLVTDWRDQDGEAAELLDTWRAGPVIGTGLVKRYRLVTFHPSYSYEDFVIGLRPVTGGSEDGAAAGFRMVDGVFKQVCAEARADPGRRHALFIDEINRANIAKVFGELITLIEPDKRAGYDADGQLVRGLEVQLPGTGGEEQGDERFGVPENLDIIGTMNTADRSIALLDIALRRRFEFEEMPPDYKVLTHRVEEVDLARLLRVINDRLEFLLDRDRLIGHSYFLKVKNLADLRSTFARNVIPLLQEYFYDDFSRIEQVLSASHGRSPFLDRETLQADSLFAGGVDSGEERVRYRVTPAEGWDPDVFRSLYERAAGKAPQDF